MTGHGQILFRTKKNHFVACEVQGKEASQQTHQQWGLSTVRIITRFASACYQNARTEPCQSLPWHLQAMTIKCDSALYIVLDTLIWLSVTQKMWSRQAGNISFMFKMSEGDPSWLEEHSPVAGTTSFQVAALLCEASISRSLHVQRCLAKLQMLSLHFGGWEESTKRGTHWLLTSAYVPWARTYS